MPLFYFKRNTKLTDDTDVAAGWQYITPEQLAMIPGVPEELAKQKAVPDARDISFAQSRGDGGKLRELEDRIAAIEERLK